MNRIGLTVYCASAGDHNDRGMRGAQVVGKALSDRLDVTATEIGVPEAALNQGWRSELDHARPAMQELADRLDDMLRQGLKPVSALSRCAAALATLPVLVHHRPGTCVVWLDAHPDLNTPDSTVSGYLGGMALSGPAGLWNSGFGNGLPMHSILLVGARDLDAAEQALVEAGKVKLIRREGDYLSRLRDSTGSLPLYVHLDCDVLNPGIVPTDYQVPGGFTLDELQQVSKVLAENPIVGLEIAEFEWTWPTSDIPASPLALLDALDPILSRLGAPI